MQLYPYQRRAVDWVKQTPKAYLAAAMGLGKTAITLKVIHELDLYPALIICPAIVRQHWAREAIRWNPPGEEAHIAEYSMPVSYTPNLTVISYERSLKIHMAQKRPWKMIVFDEAHYLKSKETMRSRRCILDKDATVLNGERVLFLSGTPAPNNISELWPTFHSIGAIKENFTKFTERYCEFERVYISGGRTVSKISGSFQARMPELRTRIAPFFMRITHEDAKIDLPSVQFSELSLQAPGEKAYEINDKTFLNLFTSRIEKSGDLETLQELAPAIATLRRVHAIRKAKPVADLIEEELDNQLYSKIVVFGHHHDALAELAGHLTKKNIGWVLVNGSVMPRDREARIEEFQKKKQCKVMLASIQAVGVGINLHSAHHMIFIEQSYVPGENAQAVARCARIGQKEKTVFVRIPTIADSFIDQRVSEIILKKTMDLKEFFS